MDHLRSADTVDLRIRNKHNALQRCYTAFENHQIKQSSYSPEEGFKLSFYTYAFDKEEILRQLMYLGPNVSLDGPPALQEELRERLRNALAHYAEPET
jgi:predicted DNA-binding transcriptional regulator YafY